MNQALQAISADLGVVKAAISVLGHRAVLPTTKSGDEVKLLVDSGGSRVKIEVNFVFRGTVLPIVRKPLVQKSAGSFHDRCCLARTEETLKAPCPSGFRQIRVHDLKHTFSRRLRAACVSFEDRQDLLGHKSARITTQIEAANKVCQEPSRKSPALLLLRSAGTHAGAEKIGGKGGNRTLDPGITSAAD